MAFPIIAHLALQFFASRRQSRSLERKRLEGVPIDAYKGWKLRHTGQKTFHKSAVPRLIAFLTIPTEGIPLNAENYRISSALFIPLAHNFVVPSPAHPSYNCRTLCPHLGYASCCCKFRTGISQMARNADNAGNFDKRH